MMISRSVVSVGSVMSVMSGLLIASACSSNDSAPGSTGDGGGAGGKGGSTSASGGKGGVSIGGASNTGGATAGACTAALAVPCDGPEDCPTGQRCCGEWNQQYVSFGCFDSCIAQQGDAASAAGGGALWFDLCHPGDTCEDPTAKCLTSTYLPSSFSRCYNTGSTPDATLGKGKHDINCGADVCGAGEQCCLRGSLTPYCAPSGTTCECNKPDGGTTQTHDAGTDASTPSTPDAGAPRTDSGAPGPTDAATHG